ncbi:MAG: PD-(D/E)XK nuclease domain-containing protein, partial [Clostridium sp.]
PLYTAVIDGDVEKFQEILNELLQSTISFNDAYENFYHGFVTGVLSGMKGYIVKSNRESGNGRSDIFMKPVSIFKKCIILELKVCSRPKELFTLCDEALNQIEKNKYDSDLKEEGYEDIIKYGIAFYRKDCVIKKK